ncbi:MAG: LytR/AlgR family response regulator transcription factor [Runella zeae]
MKVLIIEDDLLWQLKHQMMVEQLLIGAKITVADTYEAAKTHLSRELPDLVIADIIINDDIVFELFTHSFKKLPIIFVTEFPEEDLYKRAESLPNTTFLVKPFHKLTLKAAISVVSRRAGVTLLDEGRFLPVLDKYRRHLNLPLFKVIWIESDGNYSIVNTTGQKYIIKKSLTTMAAYLDEYFVQVQKSFIVNSKFIHQVDMALNKIDLHGHEIPIGRRFRKEFLDFWRDNGGKSIY